MVLDYLTSTFQTYESDNNDSLGSGQKPCVTVYIKENG